MKRVLIIYVSLLVGLYGWAAERNEAEAAALAMNFINATESHNNKARQTAAPVSVTLSYRCNQVNSTSPAFYIFNRDDQAGSVIVSADDRAEILGYTDSGTFDYATANPNVRWFLNRYQNQLSTAQEANETVANTITTTAIAPLLGAIRWEQEEPYNNLCPDDLLDSIKCPTGCVATAAAQIMFKWRYPAKGTGTHQYEWACYGDNMWDYKTKVLKMNFDTVRFDWDNMCNKYTPNRYTPAQANAVATLIYACGIACNMSYTSEGTGTYTDDMGNGMITYFGYTYTKFVTTTSERMYKMAKGWEDMPLNNMEFSCTTDYIASCINGDLEAGRPVLMGGTDENFGGHEFVCDGRDSGGLFHINWGWGNSEIGYYALNALGKSYDFSSDIDALLGLEPENRTTGLWETSASSVPTCKYMINNRLLIQRGNHLYDVQGRALY